MLDNLYSFKRDSWHVKVFTWIYGTNPTETFNTMCPYFWSWVLTFAFCWLIIPIRLLGTVGKNFLSKMESFKRDRLESRRLAFLDACNKISTDEEAYLIRKSKCWSEFGYCLDSAIYCSILDKSDDYKKIVVAKQYVREEKRSHRIKEIKTSKYFPYVAYTVTTVILVILLYGFYRLFHGLYTGYELDYKTWRKFGEVLLMLGIIGGVAYTIWICILVPCWAWLACRNISGRKLLWILFPFFLLWKGLVMLVDMIYMTYKKACPRITWKD